LAFRSSYFIIALLLAGAAAGQLGFLCYYGNDVLKDPALTDTSIPRWIARALAGFVHVIGIWLLLFFIQWGYSGLYQTNTFYEQEVGHVIPSTFYFGALVLFQMSIMPKGYEKASLRHQAYESFAVLALGLIYFLIFRISHIVRDDHYIFGTGQHRLHPKDWDHEILGLVWAGSGCAGLLLALALQQKSQLHFVFPALYVCFTMMSHSEIIRGKLRDQMVMKTWMMLHKVHAICFGVAGVCRLLGRLPESTFFFFLGALAFFFAAEDETRSLVDRLSEPGDEDDMDNHPVHHIAVLNVVMFAVILYPLHLALTGEMRKLTDPADESEGFSRIPMAMDDEDDEDEDNHRRGGLDRTDDTGHHQKQQKKVGNHSDMADESEETEEELFLSSNVT